MNQQKTMKATKCLAILLCLTSYLFAQSPTEINLFAKNFGNAPSVFLTNPDEGSDYLCLDTLNLSAIAYAPNHKLDRVEFWVDGQKVGEDKTIPFNYDWMPKDFGSYHIKATAYDTGGDFSDSFTHTITFANSYPPYSFWMSPIPYDYPTSFQIDLELDIKISPNPVQGGMVRIELITPFVKELAYVSIINSNGRRIILKELLLLEGDTITLNLSKYPSGTYYAVVTLRDDVQSEQFMLMND